MGHCSSCGVFIPNGQKVCSMCYGDPDYGNDGYYRKWLEDEEKRRFFQKKEEEIKEWEKEEGNLWNWNDDWQSQLCWWKGFVRFPNIRYVNS